MKIELEIRNVNYNETVLFWSVEPDFNEQISDIGYIPEISESPIQDGEWISLSKDPIYAYGFIDKVTQRGMVDQRLYYRIRSTKDSLSNVVCLFDEDQNYVSQYISNNLLLMQRRCGGQEALLYPRKKFGERCPSCYSPLDGKVVRAKCPQCFSTTYKGGYFAPIRINAVKDIQAKSADKTEYGVSENQAFSGWVANNVIVEPGDLLIFLKKTSERYIINQSIPSSVNNATTRQIIHATQVRADSPEQLVPVDADAYTLEDFSIFRREWKRIK